MPLSSIIYDNYMNVCSIKSWDFENFKHCCLTENTKNFLISNIYDKWSLLSEKEEKEIENKKQKTGWKKPCASCLSHIV